MPVWIAPPKTTTNSSMRMTGSMSDISIASTLRSVCRRPRAIKVASVANKDGCLMEDGDSGTLALVGMSDHRTFLRSSLCDWATLGHGEKDVVHGWLVECEVVDAYAMAGEFVQK